MTEAIKQQFRCPGEGYSIDRAVHLGRLAAFYPACRGCADRHDTGSLSREQVRQLDETARRAEPRPLFCAEGLAGVCANQLDSAVAGKLGRAMGICLRRAASFAGDAPTVVVGGDGRTETAELVATASEGLRFAGCRVIDIGEVTAGCLAHAVGNWQADGGLLVGNPIGETHTAGLKLWGPLGQPWSAGDGLDLVRAVFDGGADRPVRHCGGLERLAADPQYLARYQADFHALRPLRLVLDTTSWPLVKYLDRLAQGAACRILRPSELAASAPRAPAAERAFRPAANALQGSSSEPLVPRRLAQLGEHVRAADAHCGVWIDGDGDICHAVDDRGRAVGSERWLLFLARFLLQIQPGAAIALETETSDRAEKRVRSWGGQTVRSAATRQAMHAAMHKSHAVLGGGPSGRIWLAGTPPLSDGLGAMTLLLVILSQTDQPLSELLDAA